MTEKTILFVLDVPGGGGRHIADTLQSHFTSNSDTESLSSSFGSLVQRLNSGAFERLQPNSASSNGSMNVRSFSARARLDARRFFLSLPPENFPLVLHHDLDLQMVPFWREVVADTGLQAQFILVNTHPLLAVETLVPDDHREDSKYKALALSRWTSAMRHAMDHTGPDMIPLSYRQFLTEPTQTLQPVLTRWPGLDSRNLEEAARSIIKTRQADLAYTPMDVENDPDIPPSVKTLFSPLEALTRQGPDDAALSEIAETFITQSGELPLLTSGLAVVAEEQSALRADRDRLSAQLQTVEKDSKSLEAEIASLKARNETLSNSRDAKDVLIAELRGDLTKAQFGNDEKIGILSEKNESLSREIESNEKTIINLQALLEKLRTQQNDHLTSVETENFQLKSQLEASQQLIEEAKRDRNHLRQRMNMEKAALIKDHSREKDKLEARLDDVIEKAFGAREPSTSSLTSEINSQNQTPPSNGADPAMGFTQITTLEERLKSAEERAVHAETELRTQQSQHSARESRLQTQVTALETRTKTAEERANHAEIELRNQQNQQSATESRLHQTETRLAELEQAMIEQETDLAHHRNEAERAAEDLRQLHASTSWKISAPIRGLKTLATRPGDLLRPQMPNAEAETSTPTLPAPRSLAQRGRTKLKSIAARLIPGRNPPSPLATPLPPSSNGQHNRLRQGDLDTPDSDDTPATTTQTLDKKSDTTSLNQYVELTADTPPDATRARAIAFYLPQFHQIPENDEWWGEGFTEWTNVKPAKPQFDGHYQPHLPGELGYYDLKAQPQIMRRQAELASLHGLSAFAFYFYWFAGKTLLEGPIQKFRDDSTIDFPYCLCWANENWSRRWDGEENEILISQNHSPEDDIAFISHLATYLEDPNYLRIDGKPLIIVYRPGILPSARQTAERWRKWCRKNGIGEIYLAYSQSFDKIPPPLMGFDGAIEFPPNNHGLVGSPSLISGADKAFTGKVFNWQDLVKRSDHYPQVPYTLFRGVNPSWDNTARRKQDGTILLNSNPDDYRHWLLNALIDTEKRIKNPQERLIFINAWNEWAEGAHLEPDQHYGYAWLEATRQALATETLAENPNTTPKITQSTSPSTASSAVAISQEKKKIILVTHDFYRHGAQFLTLNFAKTLKQAFGYEVHIISGEDGPLRAQFNQFGEVSVLPKDRAETSLSSTLTQLAQQGYQCAIVNSSASGWISLYMKKAGIRFIGLVHELPAIIQSMGLEPNLEYFNSHADQVIFAANIIRDKTASLLPAKKWSNPVIAPQGLYKNEGIVSIDDKQAAHQRITSRHNLPHDAHIIMGAGFADHRKGIDIFVDWSIAAARSDPRIHSIWTGDVAADMQAIVDKKLSAASDVRDQIHLLGFTRNTQDYYHAADIYALSSREDPYPSTALEALSSGTPVVMLKNTGGIEDLARHQFVNLLEDTDPDKFTSFFLNLINRSQTDQHHISLEARDHIAAQYGFKSFVGRLLDLLPQTEGDLPAVSAIVPNYNYADYLEQRLNSLIQQTLPPREIVFLDDASSDHSVDIARHILSASGIDYRIIVNSENSGNVFKQWQRGVELARYPLTWIAEADDWADREYLATLVPHFSHSDMVLAYTESRQVDAEGNVMAGHYRDYLADVSTSKWESSFKGHGPDEVAAGFSVKNAIPNVSGALFRTAPLRDLLSTDIRIAHDFRAGGDWYIYVNLLRKGKLAFDARALNNHRRHDSSVTIRQFDLDDLREIADLQRYVAEEFSVSKALQDKARNYLHHLIAQFDLTSRYSQDELAHVIQPRET